MHTLIRGRAPAAARPAEAPSFRPYLTLANALTTASLVSGLAAVLEATRGGLRPGPLPAGPLRMAAALIVLSAVLDAADGPLARRRGTASAFGADLDSLADLVAFGVAPASMAYFAQLHQVPVPVLGLAAAAAWPVAAMWRLARFGLCARRCAFTGMPVPLAAVVLAVLAVAGLSPYAILAAAAALSALMVGTLPFPTWAGLAALAVRQGRPRR